MTSTDGRETGTPRYGNIWEEVKALVKSSTNRFVFESCVRRSVLAEESEHLLVVDVATPFDASRFSRTLADHVRAALAEIGRPNVTVRLRANLSTNDNDPDYVERDIAPLDGAARPAVPCPQA